MPATKDARTKLLDAALKVVREKGFAATSVDELCRAAGVTKGAFFHHFRSKEDLGAAAAGHWAETTGALFAAAPYHLPEDPRDRIFAYLDFRKALLDGDLAEITCFAGMAAGETYASHPAIREAAAASITGHAATLEPMFEAVLARGGAPAGVTAAGLALHTQTVLQGAFVMAKALDDIAVAEDSLEHLRRYFDCLFPEEKERRP